MYHRKIDAFDRVCITPLQYNRTPSKRADTATAPFLKEAKMVSSFPHFFFARELCVRFDRIAESVHSGRTGNFSPLADLSPPSTPLAAPPAREGRVPSPSVIPNRAKGECEESPRSLSLPGGFLVAYAPRNDEKQHPLRAPAREGRVRLFKVREGSGLFSKSPFADATNVCVYALPSIPHLRGTAIIF